ncbi:MAG: hypothetical protein JWM85_91, partial [Acidimicrobiaceae bacterium]|nr:hypothetical protein [Acidimicrobiaceae bacterium]
LELIRVASLAEAVEVLRAKGAPLR